MEKNTIWAVVLSSVVIVVWFILQPILFPTTENIDSKENVQTEISENSANESKNQELLNSSSEIAESNEENETNLSEEFITINTNKVEIILTNKGGDIVSYKLKDHIDKDTNQGVQISDSINDFNRTCSISLGFSDNKIINDLFNVEMIDEKTVLFKKNFKVKNSNGSESSFILGKRYSFKDDEYVFKMDVLLHADENSLMPDYDGVLYSIRSAPQIGPHFDAKENRYENRQFVAYDGNKSKRQVLGTNQFKRYDKEFIWCGIAGKYFVELMIPSSPEIINAGFYSTQIEKDDYANAQAIIERKSTSEKDISDTYYMYFGPRNDADLKRYNVAENNDWGIGGKKVTESLQSSGWLSWLETILKFCLEMIYKVIPNWGVAIIVLTILLKLLMFPLSKKQSLSTVKMQEIQPKMQFIQEKYKDNQQKMQQEMTKLYQEAGYNPASGCLPMIFQFLILFAMYNLFNNYFEFRGAMFIPHWIEDLSVGDSVLSFGFSIPVLGWTQLRLLPIIYTVSQLLFGKITQYGGSASAGGQNAGTMKFLTYGMPIIFFFMFYNAPSGLLLYWIVSNFFQMGQQLILNKMVKAKKAENQAKNSTNDKKLPPKAKAQAKKSNNLRK